MRVFTKRQEVKAQKLTKPTTAAGDNGSLIYGKPGDWLVENHGRKEIHEQAEFDKRFEIEPDEVEAEKGQ